jgi:hypothetical protein
VKKTLFVVALATSLVFALAASAYAGVNHSGQQRLGAAAVAPAVVPGSGTVAGAGTNTYQDWDLALGTNATDGNSPHGNYTTTTVKCVVCHAVHYAAPGGAPVGSGQTADTLLRMKASDACVYCHATTGQAVNGRPVYDGLGGAITAPGATGGATSTGHIIGTNCSYCHTNVHGADADHSVASLDGYLLKLMPQTGVTETFNAPTDTMLDAITAIDHAAENQGFAAGAALAGTIGDYQSLNTATMREQAVGVFCAECHNGAYATGAAGATTNIQGSGSVSYSGHRIAAAATANWNADGSKSSGLVSNEAVAWAAATNCKSCHDADDSLGNAAFPHSWGGSKMWLTSAEDAGVALNDELHNLPMGGGANAYNTGKPQLSDGVCLKCHVASGGAAGVGITF